MDLDMILNDDGPTTDTSNHKATDVDGETRNSVDGRDKDEAIVQNFNGPKTTEVVETIQKDATVAQTSNGSATTDAVVETTQTDKGMPSKQHPESQQNVSQTQELEQQEILTFKSPSPKSQESRSLFVPPKTFNCRLWNISRTNFFASGIVYISDEIRTIHHIQLPKDCYRVSIKQSLKDVACIPDAGGNGLVTVKDAIGTFVAWPKGQVVIEEE